MLPVFWSIYGLIQHFSMSQSNLYIDIGNSAIKWRTSDSKVFFEDIENFSITALNQTTFDWLRAVTEKFSISSEKTFESLVRHLIAEFPISI